MSWDDWDDDEDTLDWLEDEETPTHRRHILFGPLTTKQRFRNRIWKYRDSGKNVLIHHFWWFVHNAIAHPIIAVCPTHRAFRFHDYTSDKINLK